MSAITGRGPALGGQQLGGGVPEPELFGGEGVAVSTGRGLDRALRAADDRHDLHAVVPEPGDGPGTDQTGGTCNDDSHLDLFRQGG
ncbi:hypothetical protein [Streptomyces sp. NPDC088358]|uniref:hypothetical protein n=1 Tax=Streptomyces sp. NPDC088358 TaxID=3365857 RepID=UPI003825541A